MLHFKTFLRKETSSWVTFVHGAGGSSAIWYKQLRDFKKKHKVLLIDLRGHGKSKSPIYQKLKSYTFDAISDEIIEVLDHLKIKKSHFVGISLGTIVIREIAERYPERCTSMILGGAVMKLNFRGQVLMRLGALLKSVIPYLDKLTPDAEATQSVNTILLNNENKIIGHNTDIGGFENAIKFTKYDFKKKKVFLLGAGGVVPSIIFALNKMRVSSITLSNRTKKKPKTYKNFQMRKCSRKIN